MPAVPLHLAETRDLRLRRACTSLHVTPARYFRPSSARAMTRRVAELPNLGPVTAGRLAEIGIATEDDLRRVGAGEAWRSLRFLFGRAVTLIALHAMEAALRGCDWRALPEEAKAELARAAVTAASGRARRAGRRRGG